MVRGRLVGLIVGVIVRYSLIIHLLVGLLRKHLLILPGLRAPVLLGRLLCRVFAYLVFAVLQKLSQAFFVQAKFVKGVEQQLFLRDALGLIASPANQVLILIIKFGRLLS